MNKKDTHIIIRECKMYLELTAILTLTIGLGLPLAIESHQQRLHDINKYINLCGHKPIKFRYGYIMTTCNNVKKNNISKSKLEEKINSNNNYKSSKSPIQDYKY